MRPGLPTLGHGDDAQAPAVAQHPPALAENDRNVGGVEQLEGKTHKDRVDAAGVERELRRVALAQIDPAGQTCPVDPLLGHAQHAGEMSRP